MLSPVLAQQIAGETTEAIGYHVMITDAAGLVIGSGDTSRVGSFHEASLEVIRTRESAWHTPEQARLLSGVRPGITLPLLIGDEAVGTVGITGSPRQVRRFGLVVRRQTEILLQESMMLRTRMLRERALEDLVAEVAAFDPELVDEELLVATARDLGFTLLQPRVALLLEVEDAPIGPEILRSIRTVFNHHEDIVALRSATRCLVLGHHGTRPGAAFAVEAGRLIESLSERFAVTVRVAIGESSATTGQMRASCQDAEDALRLGTRVTPEKHILTIRDLRAHQALAGVPNRDRERFCHAELDAVVDAADRMELERTVVAWCENGFNLVAAARALHIHRNTLIYRLDKIGDLTNRPWRDHRAMLSLYIACLTRQLES